MRTLIHIQGITFTMKKNPWTSVIYFRNATTLLFLQLDFVWQTGSSEVHTWGRFSCENGEVVFAFLWNVLICITLEGYILLISQYQLFIESGIVHWKYCIEIMCRKIFFKLFSIWESIFYSGTNIVIQQVQILKLIALLLSFSLYILWIHL